MSDEEIVKQYYIEKSILDIQKKKEYNKLYKLKHKKNIYKKRNIKGNRKDYWNAYERQRRIDDINYDIRKRVRSRFKSALKAQSLKKEKSTLLYGINIQDIINHLGPCPGDRSLYHIDHIKPLCLFDLSKEEEIQKAFAPSNHQWLLASENLSKGCKYFDPTIKKED